MIKNQIERQRAAQQEADRTGLPVDDGCGTRWYPAGKDGISTISSSMTMSKVTSSKKTCEECGLPISVCNALTHYRLAAENHARNQFVSYERNVALARAYYADYEQEFKDALRSERS
jgi:hypothetical protein